MIGTLIGLVILCIVVGFLWWAFQQLLPLIPVAEPFTTIIKILIAGIILLIVLYAITVLLGMAGIHVPTFGAIGR